ncbi:glycosyltransferase family 2 protein [Pseudomonas sp. H11T01]|uniref:glycosyltransferase family 2 protein n=1 Tax=Pseudomonas sp. H11T01 TaxID=3402749 RepID=UPI003AC16B0D
MDFVCIFGSDSPLGTERSDCHTATVAILMCTYNGGSFLAEQLASFQRQIHRNWTVYASDDGSQDETLDLLQASSTQWGLGRLQIVEGPRRGFVANFLSLTCRADISADFYAWADQDDVWKEGKLQKALAWLTTVPRHIPALYCGRTELIGESGVPFGYSPKFSLAPHFSNALVQNIGGGNTMVFNQAARELLQEAGDNLVVPSHDWWAYLLVSGAGGIVHYDPIPTVLYRQHDENLVGTNSSWFARVKRVRMTFQGRFYEWTTQNIHALETMRHRLSQEHQAKLAQFKAARGQKFLLRILGFQRAGLYRQTLFGNLGLILATLLKKI